MHPRSILSVCTGIGTQARERSCVTGKLEKAGPYLTPTFQKVCAANTTHPQELHPNQCGYLHPTKSCSINLISLNEKGYHAHVKSCHSPSFMGNASDQKPSTLMMHTMMRSFRLKQINTQI